MAQEKIQTTIVVATAEPTIEASPIEDMLALPEAESAIMEEQRRKGLRENFSAFLSYFYEQRHDVFASWQSPLITTMRKFLDQPNQQEVTEYGIHFTRNEPGASGIYKPPKKKGEWDVGDPLKDMYTAWDWDRRITAFRGRFDELSTDEDKQNAFALVQAERNAGRRMLDRLTRSLMTSVAHVQTCSADSKVQETLPVRDLLISTPSGRPNFFRSVYDAGLALGSMTQTLPARDLRISMPSGRSNFFWLSNALSHGLFKDPFLPTLTTPYAHYAAERQKEAQDLREAEVRFNLPSGTMNVTCMSARTAISIVESYIGLHPKSTAQDVVALLRREEISF